MPLRFTTLLQLTAPAVEPVSLEEAKAQLQLLHSDDDADISFMITAAREWAEEFTSRSLIYHSWVALYAAWPAEDRTLVIPRPQLSVVELVRYRDADDELVELNEDEDFTVDELSNTLTFRSTFSFPSFSLDRPAPLEVIFRAGYGDAAVDVPKQFKQAIRLCVAAQYGVDRGNTRTQVSFRAPNIAERVLHSLRLRPL